MLPRYCRRYWFVTSACDALYVEDPEGEGVGVVSSKEELDTIIESLNTRGSR